MDYAPSVYTDINVFNGGLATGGLGFTTIVPYRNKSLAAKGLLKDGKTAISEITDGTSNTIAIIECAGRDERFVSQYLEKLVSRRARIGARWIRERCAAPLLEVGRPGLGFRDVRSAQQPRTTDQRGRALAHDGRDGR